MNKVQNDLCLEQFSEVFLRDTPLLDVRSPIEFNAGSFPAAYNLPILNDEQRHLVGTKYAEQGQAAAIDLGQQLATREIRAQRIESWSNYIVKHPQGYLFCFRGGLRSKTTQSWLAESGCNYPLVEGGYKAMRGFLLAQLERLCEKGNILLVSGATGVGKTELIKAQSSFIDLEGRANHRGSAFGRTFSDQPAQIAWENQIIIDWLKCEAQSGLPVLIEAESHLIGRIHLPQPLQDAMARAPILALETDWGERVERIYQDYVLYSLVHFKRHTQDPWQSLQTHIMECLQRIQKRLGGLRFKQLCQILPDAIAQLRDQNDPSGFYSVIDVLLRDYYDGLYLHHMEKSLHKVIFSGNMSEISAWLNDHADSNDELSQARK